MTVESLAFDMDNLRRLARLHAVLADQGRLAVVTSLRLGDASPTELQRLLGMPSNLLAHHLRVLERAELVSRRRSSGDGRRCYVRLTSAGLDMLSSPDQGERTCARVPSRVVFVCTGNSARSQLAAALWAQVGGLPVTSAGTQPARRLAPGAVAAARRHGLRLTATRPRHLREVVERDDFMVTVCDRAHEQLTHPSVEAQAVKPNLHWSVPDPVPIGTARAFDLVVHDLSRRVSIIALQLPAPETSR